MYNPEKFAFTAKETEKKLHSETGRRGVLFSFLQKESEDPSLVDRGLDINNLNANLAEVDADDVLLDFGSKKGRAGRFMARFSSDVKYVTAAALEKTDDGQLPTECAFELSQLKKILPFLRDYTKKVAMRAGLDKSIISNEKIIIGFATKERDTEMPLTGGYHSDLSEQGYKAYDMVVQGNLRIDTSERPEYRAIDLLRGVAHDAVHSMQYKQWGGVAEKIAMYEKRLATAMQDGEPEEVHTQLKQRIATLKDEAPYTNLDLVQYGSAFFKKDTSAEKNHVPLGAALFEYITDKIARESVKDFMKKEGITLPSPESQLEELDVRDWNGEAIQEQDVQGLEGKDEKIGNIMKDYATDILDGAHEVLQALGPLREEFEEALTVCILSGKFTKMQEFGKRLNATDYTLSDGTRLPKEKFEEWAKHTIILRPLVEPQSWKK